MSAAYTCRFCDKTSLEDESLLDFYYCDECGPQDEDLCDECGAPHEDDIEVIL
jgi:hypothetical protein